MSPSSPPCDSLAPPARSAIGVGVGLLVAVSLGAALAAATRVATARSLAQASENMHAARTAFYVLVRRARNRPRRKRG